MSLQRLSRLAGPALTVGGLLWITIHLIVIVVGLQTGKLAWNIPTAQQPLLARLYYPSLYLSSLILCVGLLGCFVRLKGRARKAGIIGLVLAAIGIVTSLVTLIFVGITGHNSFLEVLTSITNPCTGLSTLLATVFLGWAALRVQVLSRLLAWILIAVGIATFPVLIVSPLPIVPDWATDTLAFFLGGIGYTVVGLRMQVGRKRTGGTFISPASQAK